MSRRVAVSVTPDLALDQGNTYAGGLGVLEGDKFYAAARMGLDYRVLTLYYRNGYVEYDFDAEGRPVPRPQPQPKEFTERLRAADEFRITLRGQEVSVRALELAEGSARAVFLSPASPDWAAGLADRLYVDSGPEEMFLKYALLARASEAYLRRNVGLDNIEFI
ncbi:MAG: glycogen/starch/alpha-glucan phosphorylase, partial [Conexivisphaera sp.]